jgi:DMSO/TMAO reductase YedYZ heme-binding membrane subunit
MDTPALWWFVSRASGIVAWSLLVIAVIVGILLSTRVLKPNDNAGWLFHFHSWLSGLTFVFAVTHVVSLMLDTFVTFTILDVAVPFYSDYIKIPSLGRIPIALGVMSLYILFAVQLTSLFRQKMTVAAWKAVHLSSYVLVLLVSAHAGWTGTDISSLFYRSIAIFLLLLTIVAFIIRLMATRFRKG